MNREQNRRRWRHYLHTTPTYGTPEDRSPEYSICWGFLKASGITSQDLLVDVGCGDCGLDIHLRSRGYRGQYLAVDGSIDGTELDTWAPTTSAEWFVCIEVIEHLKDPLSMLDNLRMMATKGVFVSTPNPAVVDVLAVDSTHVTPVWQEQLTDKGYETDSVQLNNRGEGDTLLGWWTP